MYHISQPDSMDCGSAYLRMVAMWHSRNDSPEYLRSLTCTGHEGVALVR